MADKHDLPSFEKYFPPTVHAMRSRGGSATIEELEEDVAKLMNLPEALLAIPHKSGSRSQFGPDDSVFASGHTRLPRRRRGGFSVRKRRLPDVHAAKPRGAPDFHR
jgi:hypothetical protein